MVSKFTPAKAKQLWKELFGWKVGDRVQKQGATRMLHGKIHSFQNVVRWNRNKGVTIPSAVIYWDTASPIPRVQLIPVKDLEVEE